MCRTLPKSIEQCLSTPALVQYEEIDFLYQFIVRYLFSVSWLVRVRSCCLLIRKDGDGGRRMNESVSGESLNGPTKENTFSSVSVYDNKFTSYSRVSLFFFIHTSL